MALNLVNLDAATRKYMLEEIEIDERAGRLYISSRLSNRGALEYPALLKAAAIASDDSFLANELRAPGRLNSSEPRNTKSGVTYAKVPVTAPETLAEGEFNRFYARGLCRRAINDGKPRVRVYRAKDVLNPRRESIALIGQILDAEKLLEDLRQNTGTDTALRLPPGPNSGLSICLV
ncbi:MAG: hypothetical protein ABSE99_11480 [Terracidiphilus sp.]